jgi:hypothetical protein
MMRPPLLLIAAPQDPFGMWLSELLEQPILPQPTLLQMRGRLVHVVGSSDLLKHFALRTTLSGAVAVLASPTTPLPLGRSPTLDRLSRSHPLPFWTRRYHRFICRDQETARQWGQAGLSLGRIMVVEAQAPGPQQREALEGMYQEVLRMRA